MENEISDRDANKLFWYDYCEHCKKCLNKCKQSFKVIQIICPKFNKVGE